MSNHRMLLWVTIATLIFSAASAAADRLGPRAAARAAKTCPDEGRAPGR